MADTETRFSELRSEDRQLIATIVSYGDVAVVGGQPEMFAVGAFGPDVATRDVILNSMHQRTVPLARVGAGLELRDASDALRMTATLPDTPTANEVLTLVRTGVLRGVSLEFQSKRERLDESGTRIIESAEIVGVGVVDRPAYPASVVEARAEIRQDGDTLIAIFPFNQPLTTRDRGTVRKAQWQPDSWRFALEDLEREISLNLGKFETSTQLASRKGGTLRLQPTADELRMEADINRAVSYADDFMKNLESGNVFYSLTPRQSIPPAERVKIPYRDIPEPGNPSVKIRVFEETILHGFYIRRTGGLGQLQTRWKGYL